MIVLEIIHALADITLVFYLVVTLIDVIYDYIIEPFKRRKNKA